MIKNCKVACERTGDKIRPLLKMNPKKPNLAATQVKAAGLVAVEAREEETVQVGGGAEVDEVVAAGNFKSPCKELLLVDRGVPLCFFGIPLITVG